MNVELIDNVVSFRSPPASLSMRFSSLESSASDLQDDYSYISLPGTLSLNALATSHPAAAIA